MTILNNRQSLYICILRDSKQSSHEHNKSKAWLLDRHMSAQLLLYGHMSTQYVHSFAGSLVLLGIVYVLVDIRD